MSAFLALGKEKYKNQHKQKKIIHEKYIKTQPQLIGWVTSSPAETLMSSSDT